MNSKTFRPISEEHSLVKTHREKICKKTKKNGNCCKYFLPFGIVFLSGTTRAVGSLRRQLVPVPAKFRTPMRDQGDCKDLLHRSKIFFATIIIRLIHKFENHDNYL